MDEHPTPLIMKDLLLGRLSAEDERQAITHLLAGCPRCREEIAPTAAVLFHPGRPEAAPSPDGDDLYDPAITSAVTAALRRWRSLERERAGADAQIDRLLAGETIAKKSAFWTWGLCERLLERSWDLRHKDPARMLAMARHAVETAQRLHAHRHGAYNVEDLLARAWGGLTNAYRIADQLSLAETALEQAFAAFHRGSRPPLLRARLAEISASLLCDQRQFPAAFRALDLSCRLYRKHKARHDAGRTLIQKGLHSGYTGDPEEGIQLLARGLRLLDRDRDPKLIFQALHNILLFRVERGDFKAARRQIWEMRPLYRVHDDRLAEVKLRWVEGKVFLGLGEVDRAARAFEQARESFLEEELSYDAALVSFDLAAIWLRGGKRQEVRRLLHEMLETFRARYIAREAIATLLLLRDAAERDELTLDLLETAALLLQSLKGEPKAD